MFGMVESRSYKMVTNLINPHNFKKLSGEHNVMRFISIPYYYAAHNVANRVKHCLNLTNMHDECKICNNHSSYEENVMAKFRGNSVIRFIAGIIDRLDNNIKIVDLPTDVFYTLKKLAEDPDWGSLLNYDINIAVDLENTRPWYYTVIPCPKRKISPEEEKKVAIFRDSYLEKMRDFCEPTCPNNKNHFWHPLDENSMHKLQQRMREKNNFQKCLEHTKELIEKQKRDKNEH